jgi:3-oxoacyl-[acyl-carrier-protein] synthase III
VTKARITGTGSCLPEKILTNAEIATFLDTSDEWITTRTGIRERRIAAENEVTSDLAVRAARSAMEMAGVEAGEIDQIIVGTITGDFPWPATACVVQHKLGAAKAYAYDVSAACSGFVYALTNGKHAIESGAAKKVLVIGAEVLSRAIDWTDRNTCVLFGDGAGAVILEASEGERGILSSHLHSDGAYLELLYQPGFGAAHPPSEQGLKDRQVYLRMQGNEVFKVAVRSLSEVALESLAANGLQPSDLALFIPHQANRRILEASAKRIGLRDDQVFINVDRYGNTSGATIPVALDEAFRGGRIKENDLIMFDAFGGGFTWGAVLVRW